MTTKVSPSVPAANTAHPHWQGILECAAQEVFQMMAGANLTPLPVGGEPPKGEQTAIVGMAGALCGMTSVQCSTKTAAKLASFMLGGDRANNPGMIADALGELCNMVAGNFKAKITTLEDRCMLSAPIVISGGDYLLRALEPSERLRAAFDCEGGENGVIWVQLTIHT
jgi:chemotaxis protein CheX